MPGVPAVSGMMTPVSSPGGVGVAGFVGWLSKNGNAVVFGVAGGVLDADPGTYLPGVGSGGATYLGNTGSGGGSRFGWLPNKGNTDSPGWACAGAVNKNTCIAITLAARVYEMIFVFCFCLFL